MANDQHKNLDTVVKETLSNLEVPFEPAHWAEMEHQLNAQPASYSFRWKFSLNIFLGLAAVGIALFFILRPAEKSSEKEKIPVVRTQAPVKSEPDPVLTNIDQNGYFTEIKETAEVQTASEIEAAPPTETDTKETASVEKPNLKFGDEIDKTKGFVNPTKEDVSRVGEKGFLPVPNSNELIRVYEEGRTGVPLANQKREDNPFDTDTAVKALKKDTSVNHKNTSDTTNGKRKKNGKKTKPKFQPGKSMLDP